MWTVNFWWKSRKCDVTHQKVSMQRWNKNSKWISCMYYGLHGHWIVYSTNDFFRFLIYIFGVGREDFVEYVPYIDGVGVKRASMPRWNEKSKWISCMYYGLRGHWTVFSMTSLFGWGIKSIVANIRTLNGHWIVYSSVRGRPPFIKHEWVGQLWYKDQW